MTDAPATDALDAGPDPPPGPTGGTIRRDIASAYLVTAARVGAWAVISALVYRLLGSDAFAMLALIRSTVGLLAYTSLGLAPAMVRALAMSGPGRHEVPKGSYATPSSRRPEGRSWESTYASGESLAMLSAGLGTLLCVAYGLNSGRLHSVPPRLVGPVTGMSLLFGFGMVLRLVSEAPASLLQVRGRIALDNFLLSGAEAVWVAGTLIFFLTMRLDLECVGLAFFASNLFLLIGRVSAARWITGCVARTRNGANWREMRRLLVFGVGVAVAQAADFLYAPTDYILINRLIGPGTVAVYAPAVQIDAGLQMIVTGLAAVLLPHSALAHAAGDHAAVRRYYIRGTLASIALLIPTAAAAWLAAPLLLRSWLGVPMPQTLAILPIVLLNTVVGGSSAVGRSALLSMGKVRAFTLSVVVAGAANVLLSFVFVRFFSLGLVGIILGTIVAVIGRCAIWMPWYVLRSLKQAEAQAASVPGALLTSNLGPLHFPPH